MASSHLSEGGAFSHLRFSAGPTRYTGFIERAAPEVDAPFSWRIQSIATPLSKKRTRTFFLRLHRDPYLNLFIGFFGHARQTLPPDYDRIRIGMMWSQSPDG